MFGWYDYRLVSGQHEPFNISNIVYIYSSIIIKVLEREIRIPFGSPLLEVIEMEITREVFIKYAKEFQPYQWTKPKVPVSHDGSKLVTVKCIKISAYTLKPRQLMGHRLLCKKESSRQRTYLCRDK